MSYRVVKPFKSTVRRFHVGTEIALFDDLAPHTIQSAIAAGLIQAVQAEPMAKLATKVEAGPKVSE